MAHNFTRNETCLASELEIDDWIMTDDGKYRRVLDLNKEEPGYVYALLISARDIDNHQPKVIWYQFKVNRVLDIFTRN